MAANYEFKSKKKIIKHVLVGLLIVSVFFGCSKREDKQKSLMINDSDPLQMAIYNLEKGMESGDKKLVVSSLDEVFNEIKWDDLKIDLVDIKTSVIGGYIKKGLKGRDYFVSKEAFIETQDLRGVDLFNMPYEDAEVGLKILLSEKGKNSLSRFTSKNIGGNMGVVIDEKLIMVIPVNVRINTRQIEVMGLTPDEAKSVINRFYKPLKEFHVMRFII